MVPDGSVDSLLATSWVGDRQVWGCALQGEKAGGGERQVSGDRH